MMNCGGVYKITLIPTGWFYVGSAVKIRARFNRHKSHLRLSCHHNSYLQKAWNSYGECNFEFSVIELVPDPSQLLVREQFWIDKLEAWGPSGFNMAPTAGSVLGIRKSPESIAKTAAAHRGMKRSDEARARIREAIKGRRISESQLAALAKYRPMPTRQMVERSRQYWLGRKHTPETLERLRVAATGKIKSPATIEKHRIAGLKRGLPLSAREKSRAYWTGRKHRAETLEKLRKASTGRTFTDEAKAKMGAPHKGRKKSREQVEKRIATFKRNRLLRAQANGEAFQR